VSGVTDSLTTNLLGAAGLRAWRGGALEAVRGAGVRDHAEAEPIKAAGALAEAKNSYELTRHRCKE
jgi:hypothetical protein